MKTFTITDGLISEGIEIAKDVYPRIELFPGGHSRFVPIYGVTVNTPEIDGDVAFELGLQRHQFRSEYFLVNTSPKDNDALVLVREPVVNKNSGFLSIPDTRMWSKAEEMLINLAQDDTTDEKGIFWQSWLIVLRGANSGFVVSTGYSTARYIFTKFENLEVF